MNEDFKGIDSLFLMLLLVDAARVRQGGGWHKHGNGEMRTLLVLGTCARATSYVLSTVLHWRQRIFSIQPTLISLLSFLAVFLSV